MYMATYIHTIALPFGPPSPALPEMARLMYGGALCALHMGACNLGLTLRRPYWWVDVTAKRRDWCQSQCPFFTPQKSIPIFEQNRPVSFVCALNKRLFLLP